MLMFATPDVMSAAQPMMSSPVFSTYKDCAQAAAKMETDWLLDVSNIRRGIMRQVAEQQSKTPELIPFSEGSQLTFVQSLDDNVGDEVAFAEARTDFMRAASLFAQPTFRSKGILICQPLND